MPSDVGFHTSRIADLRLSSPTNGFLLKAIEQITQGHVIGALTSLFTALELSPLLKGEEDSIITFTHDPLSWSLRMTGPTPGKDNTVYLNTVDRQTQEIKVEDKEDLIHIAELVVCRLHELLQDREVTFHCPALPNDTLLKELRGVDPL